MMRKATRRSEEDFAEEIASHLELEAADLRAEGQSDAEAQRRARVAFGSRPVAQERFHARNRAAWVGHLMRDLNFAQRQLRRSPGFALTAILTLALGLGANTAVFSLINSLLLRSLPVPHADRLAIIANAGSDDPAPNPHFSAPMFRALEKHHEIFEDVAAYSNNKLLVRSSSGNVEVEGALVSGEFFRELQTAPALGRFLTPQDDHVGNSYGYAAVISNGFWRKWFNGAPGAVGSKLVVANTVFTVVGVMPRSFIGANPALRPDFYLPLSAEPIIDAPFNMTAMGEHATFLQILARRNPDVSLEQANAALKTISNPILAESIPDASTIKADQANHFQLVAEPGSRGNSYLRAQFKKPLIVVFSLCAALLLLACMNLASLLMARATAREQELATRLAVGASRGQLIKQLLIESLLIASIGTAVGLAVAPIVSRSLATLLLSQNPAAVIDTSLDLRVFVFAAALAIVATVFTGLIPALRATGGDLNEHIKNGANASSAKQHRGFVPKMLLGLEVSLALILVIGAGLLSISLTRLYRAGIGFEPRGLVNFHLDMSKQSLAGDALLRWYQNLDDAVSRQPGVRNVSFQLLPPFSGVTFTDKLKSSISNGEKSVSMNQVGPAYFAAMRIPVLEGREFQWQDSKASGAKVILNQSAAKILFPNQDAVGKFVLEAGEKPSEVIAVVGDVNYSSIREPAQASIYESITQTLTTKNNYEVVVRLDGPAAPLAVAVRNLTTRVDPDIPAPVMTSVVSILDASITSERMMALLSVFFAVCALLATAIGLYGTLSYATVRRTREIGVRMALGAQRLQVILLVLRENAQSAGSGVLAGLVVAFLASRALGSLLYGTSTRDPLVLVGAVAVLCVVAGAASLLPAVRAARIEPVRALRND